MTNTITSQNIGLSSWVTLFNMRKHLKFIYMCPVWEPFFTLHVLAHWNNSFHICCSMSQSTVFSACGVLAQLMHSCGHERIVPRRCQTIGEYRARGLCHLSSSPSWIHCVKTGLDLCGNVVVHHLWKIVVHHGKSMSDLWWTQWNSDRFLSWYFGSPLSTILPMLCTHFICHWCYITSAANSNSTITWHIYTDHHCVPVAGASGSFLILQRW